MNKIRLRGNDDLATFGLTRGTCAVCNKKNILVVRYARYKEVEISSSMLSMKVYHMLTWTDILKHTILGRAYDTDLTEAGNLGVQCGCYAKFHRQLAHITDSIECKRSAHGN